MIAPASPAPAANGRACLVLPVSGLKSNGLARRVERGLTAVPGVEGAAAHVAASVIRIDHHPEQTRLEDVVGVLRRHHVTADLDHARWCARPGAGPGTAARDAAPRRSPVLRTLRFPIEHHEVGLVLLGGLLLVAGTLTYALEGPMWLRLSLLALSAVCTSTETAVEAWRTLRRFRLDVDVLMFAAAIGASLLGHYEEGAFLLFLFGLGHAGEDLALDKARSAIRALSEVAPAEALRLAPDGSTTLVPVEEIAVGDRVRVRPFDRVPVDGDIETGRSAINQATITGESTPVDKQPGDEVFAGTINGEGQIVVRATKLAGETTLARVIRLVEEAQASKSPTEQFTETIERYYVPVVFVATGVLIAAPPLLGWQPVMGGGSVWGGWFYQAMAFLTAASPCALAIGTPAAVLCGVARSAQIGVLIKGGAALEQLGRARTIAFDKTGTLTRGQPAVVAVEPMGEMSARDLLALAAAVEAHVNHPLADAIAQAAQQQGVDVPEAADVQQVAGLGAAGVIDGVAVRVGKAEDGGDRAVAARMGEIRAAGQTVVAVHCDDELAGLIAIADQLRPEAAAAIANLRDLRLADLTMLTGDHAAAAEAIGQALGLDHVYAGLLPEQKLERIDAMTRRGPVAMVGDGVNDAPALAKADVGIAMGAAGADVAMETADVVLMSSNLRQLPRAIALSRASRRIITQNLVLALGTIAIVSPLAAIGLANLGVAVLLHEGSTVVVVLNALRLLRAQRDGKVQEQMAGDARACATCGLGPEQCLTDLPEVTLTIGGQARASA